MVLNNFITLEQGKPAVLHFVDHEFQERAIRDPLTSRAKLVNILIFAVDELDGRSVSSQFGVTSEKLAQALAPFLPGKAYQDRLFTITQQGTGFLTEYQVMSEPLRR